MELALEPTSGLQCNVLTEHVSRSEQNHSELDTALSQRSERFSNVFDERLVVSLEML